MIEEMTLRISIIMPTDVLGDKSNLYKAVTQRLFSMNASLHDVWNRISPETIRNDVTFQNGWMEHSSYSWRKRKKEPRTRK